MHSEWLTDHLSGESSSNMYLYGEAEDDEIEGVLASELREKLIKGETAS